MKRPTLPSALPALCWAGFITALSHGFVDSRDFVHKVSQAVPAATTEQGFSNFWSQWWWFFVKGWHVMEFFVLTLLLLRVTRNPALAATLGVLAATLDEWHQTFIPKRGGHASDVAIDALGVAMAILLVQATSRLPSRASQIRNPRLSRS